MTAFKSIPNLYAWVYLAMSLCLLAGCQNTESDSTSNKKEAVEREHITSEKNLPHKNASQTKVNPPQNSKTKKPIDPQTTTPAVISDAQYRVSTRRILNLIERAHYVDVESINNLESRIIDMLLEHLDPDKNLIFQKDADDVKASSFDLKNLMENGNIEELNIILDHLLSTKLSSLAKIEALWRNHRSVNSPSVSDNAPAIATKRLVRPGSKQEFSDYWSAHKHLIDNQIQSAGVGTNIDDFHKNWIAFQRLQLSSLSKNDRYRIISNAILNAIDPHSEYIVPVGYRNEPLRGTDLHAWQHIANVGIESRRFDGAHIVFAVQPGSPADIENIRPGSEIIAVIKDHVSLTVTNLDDLSLRRLLEGSEGSEVTLIVRDSDDPNNIRAVDLKYSALYSSQVGITSEIVSRNQVNIASSRHVGILKIPFFYDELSENVKPYLAEFKAQNIDTVIIDLRNNGGGSLAESTRFSGLFINSGPVMQIRYSTGKIAVNKDTDDKSYFDGNLIVLVNSHTAGSCEIFAAAMQDYGRAIIVGETTFGMGSVRQHRGLGRTYDFYDAPMGSIQFTLATYYRVNGDGMQLKGVTPDIAFPMTNKYKLREQDNPYAIPWEATRAVEYEKSADLEATINQLKNISTELDPNAIDPELSKTIEMAFSLSSEKN